jgi:hypothetical protein
MSRILFLLGCIPVRLLLVLTVFKLSPVHLKYFSIILFCIGFSFLYLFFTNSRLKAPEAGGETWWYNLRPIHAGFYLTAAVYAAKGQNIAGILLLCDVLFGTFAYLYKETKQ